MPAHWPLKPEMHLGRRAGRDDVKGVVINNSHQQIVNFWEHRTTVNKIPSNAVFVKISL